EEAIADFKCLEELELADNKEQQLLLGLANAYRRVGDEANADKYFKELATKFPDAQDQVTRAKFDLAMTLRGQGKFDEAEKLLRQAIDDAVGAEQKSQAIGELATLMLDSGRTDEGLKLLNDELQNLAPGSQLWAEFQIKIAAQNQYRGQNEEAVRILENVTKYELDNSVNQWARTALMDAYASINRVDQAIEQAKIVQTLTDDPMIITTTQMNLAQLYWRDGKNEEALAILEDLSKTGHTDDQKAQAVTMRMELLQQAGRRDDAVAVARSVISENELPRLVLAARVQLAEIYNNEGNNGEAKKVLEEVLTEPLPDDLPGNFMRLPGLSNTDELRETILNIFQKLVDKLAPGEGDQAYTYWLARMTVGMIDDQMGETDKAVRELSEAFAKASDPNLRLQAGESLGQTYTRAEQLDEAEAVYTKIGETWPDRSDAQVTSLIGLGTVARRARNFDRAEETYQKALGMCNTDPMLCCRIQGERLQAFRESNQAEKIREVYRAVLDGLPDCWLREEALQALKPEAPAEGGEGG
ncbi:tetratricopeptide repeat protein, partial [bacterium]|nr:tetratricopeptide repeat protein [bacterium]